MSVCNDPPGGTVAKTGEDGVQGVRSLSPKTDDEAASPSAPSSPWPIVMECHWPAPSLVAADHFCQQCDGSHDHEWLHPLAAHIRPE